MFGRCLKGACGHGFILSIGDNSIKGITRSSLHAEKVIACSWWVESMFIWKVLGFFPFPVVLSVNSFSNVRTLQRIGCVIYG
ncbi:hypothetical protein ACOSQ4_031011 [Xanthoceras sorbifolium]